MKNTSKRHFSCSDCGYIYTSPVHCVCPTCRSGVVNQVQVDSKEVHALKSYTHEQKPNSYRKKAACLNPEYIKGQKVNIDVEGEYLNTATSVDWCAFTVKLSDFRHCTKSGPFSGIKFPTMPALPPMRARSNDDVESINDYRERVYTKYFEECVVVFITKVLGFGIGVLKEGAKFNFYDNHFDIETSDGIFCGRVGYGGSNQKGTIHFSLNGHGCKHLFTTRSRQYVHYWLSNILNVTCFTRLDIAFDDFDGIHNCENVELAFLDDGFKRSRGISPTFKNDDEWFIDADGNKIFSCEMRRIGSRQSLVHWRIYNKKLEQKIDKDGFVWYRSEVELKKVSVDILIDIDGYFAGLNNYASSLFSSTITPKRMMFKAKKRFACEVLQAAYWAKRQYGRLVNSLFDLYQGDCQKVVTSLMRDDGVIGFTSMHRKLVNSL
ncbi:replication initiation factor domain-containing protein [Vibrio lentus]|uniref:replication initiation factor domain-containing protein n=1 Tax=Vibrio lentus TaxID=136468 RepID=UPI000C863FA6|nr:replication initiation factor domain-containing protein [Vibrio lentus]PMM22395.1 replication initiation factor family protein [Vibrio lentus]